MFSKCSIKSPVAYPFNALARASKEKVLAKAKQENLALLSRIGYILIAGWKQTRLYTRPLASGGGFSLFRPLIPLPEISVFGADLPKLLGHLAPDPENVDVSPFEPEPL